MGVRPIAARRVPLDAELVAPPSKSVTHRALVAAALARGPSILAGALVSADTRATRQGLAALGIRVDDTPAGLRVEGTAGEIAGGGTLDLHESGTSLRLLVAVAALGRRPSRITGGPRLAERPIEELVGGLLALGSCVQVEGPSGLPLEVGGRRPAGGAVRISGSRSSQFASALLLVAPRLTGGLIVEIAPPAVSLPYVEMTARVLEAFGVTVRRDGATLLRVSETDYPGRAFAIEGDWSSASPWLAAAAICGGRVRVRGLRHDTAQPDARLPELLGRLGCGVARSEEAVEIRGGGRIPPFEVDLGEAPDLAPTVVALALFSDGPCVIRGIAHLRHKESDRLTVLAESLVALGRPARAHIDRLEVGPPGSGRGARVRTASDHRIAMAFAVAGLRQPGIEIDDPDCVAKSNPTFWRDFARLELEL